MRIAASILALFLWFFFSQHHPRAIKRSVVLIVFAISHAQGIYALVLLGI